MRKISMTLIVIVVFLVGCATGQGQPQIQINPEDQAIIGKIAGRHAGNELAKHYLDIAGDVATVCSDIIKEDNPDIIITLVKSAITILSDNQINDKLLKADIKDILGMIDVKSGIEVTGEQMVIIKAVAEGLQSGIKITE